MLRKWLRWFDKRKEEKKNETVDTIQKTEILGRLEIIQNHISFFITVFIDYMLFSLNYVHCY